MKDTEKIVNILREFLRNKNPRILIDASTKLVSGGIMESVELLDFLLSLESHGIEIDLDSGLDIDSVLDIINYVK